MIIVNQREVDADRLREEVQTCIQGGNVIDAIVPKELRNIGNYITRVKTYIVFSHPPIKERP